MRNLRQKDKLKSLAEYRFYINFTVHLVQSPLCICQVGSRQPQLRAAHTPPVCSLGWGAWGAAQAVVLAGKGRMCCVRAQAGAGAGQGLFQLTLSVRKAQPH